MTTSIADRGRKHLADALAGTMNHCLVPEWPDEKGKPTAIYWKPLTGVEQKQIDEAGTPVERTAMVVKVRARDADGNLIYKNTGLTSLINDFDYDTIRAISYLISGDITVKESEQNIEDAVKDMKANSDVFMAYEYATAIGIPASQVLQLPVAEYTTGFLAYLNLKKELIEEHGTNHA